MVVVERAVGVLAQQLAEGPHAALIAATKKYDQVWAASNLRISIVFLNQDEKILSVLLLEQPYQTEKSFLHRRIKISSRKTQKNWQILRSIIPL